MKELDLYDVIDIETKTIIFRGPIKRIKIEFDISNSYFLNRLTSHRVYKGKYLFYEYGKTPKEYVYDSNWIENKHHEEDYLYLATHLNKFGNTIIWSDPECYRERLKAEHNIDISIKHFDERVIRLCEPGIPNADYVDREHWIVEVC